MTGIFSFLHSGISFTSEITNCNYQAVGWCEKSEVYAGPSVRVSGRWNIELFCCTGSTGLHLCQTLLGAACGQGLGLSFRGLCTGLAEGEWHTGWLSGCISPLMSEGGKSSHSLDHCPSDSSVQRETSGQGWCVSWCGQWKWKFCGCCEVFFHKAFPHYTFPPSEASRGHVQFPF